MKRLKIWMVGCLFASLVAVTVVKVNPQYGETVSGDIILINMEVLAQGEQGDNDCAGSGSITCGSGTYKVKYN